MNKDRIAAQPVSWGINYLPGWGRMLEAEEILSDVKDLGLSAMEYQPGLLPEDARAARATFDEWGIRPAAGWVHVALATADRTDALAAFRSSAQFLSALGAPIATIGAAGPSGDFESEVVLTDDEWGYLAAGLDEISDIAGEMGVTVALHPHIGTAVEKESDIERIQSMSSVGFCYDTGHIAAAGGDPVKVARLIADRTVHVHLKDVDATLTKQLIAGDIKWAEAVGAGIFTPLGQGDVDLDAVMEAFADYAGTYVIEQDIRLLTDGFNVVQDPVANMRTSMAYLEAF